MEPNASSGAIGILAGFIQRVFAVIILASLFVFLPMRETFAHWETSELQMGEGNSDLWSSESQLDRGHTGVRSGMRGVDGNRLSTGSISP